MSFQTSVTYSLPQKTEIMLGIHFHLHKRKKIVTEAVILQFASRLCKINVIEGQKSTLAILNLLLERI